MNDGENNLPSPAAFEKLLENQSRELAIKEKEIDLEREKNIAAQRTDERQFEFAREHLASIERDRQNDRFYRQTVEKKSLILIIIFIVAVAVFLTTAVMKDKDEMIIELVKIVAYGVPCGFGGYAVGRYKTKNDENKIPPPQQ
jgi:hypothetical protein